MKEKIKYIFPSALLMIALLFIYEGIVNIGFWEEDKGPLGGFYPVIIATVLIVVTGVCLLQTAKEKIIQVDSEELKLIVSVIGIIIGAYVIGLLLSIEIYLILWMRRVEKLNWKKSLIFSISTIGIVYLIFGIWLEVQFPMGLLNMI